MTSAHAETRDCPQNHHGSIAVLVLIAVFVYFVIPRAPLAEYDPDEGLNLMKALLTYKGFHLYREIWSDQPPLLTWLLSLWSGGSGFSLESGRMLVLCFTTLLLWTLYLLIRLKGSVFTGFLGVVFLTVSAKFLQAAGAVMIGLPAISLAFLSLYFATRYSIKRSSLPLLCCSAVVFGAAVLTKAFVLVYGPAIFFVTGFYSPEEPRPVKIDLRALIIWCVVFVGSFLLLALALEPALLTHVWSQIIAPHRLGLQHPSPGARELIPLMLRQDRAFLFLAGAGVVFGMLRRRSDFLLPLFCLLGGTIFLVFSQTALVASLSPRFGSVMLAGGARCLRGSS